MSLESFECNPLGFVNEGLFGSSCPSASSGNTILLTHPVLSLTTRLCHVIMGRKDSGGLSHPAHVTLTLQRSVTKLELQVLINAHPGAPELGRRYQRDLQKHHPDVTGSSRASGFVSRPQQGAEKLLSAPNSHKRKTKFHHNVDHLWMRIIFQKRPLEREDAENKNYCLKGT